MKMHDVIAMGLLCASTCWSQTGSGTPASTTQAINAQNANNVCRIYFQKPKVGSDETYEQARVKHFQFHKSKGDTWSWNTWRIETGDNTGTYVVSTCGHAWKDFDDWEKKMGKEDTANANTTFQSVLVEETDRFYTYRSDLSLAPPNAPIAKMESVAIYVLRPGTQEEFMSALRRINEALKKEPSWPKKSGWLQLANGGEAPTFVLLADRQGWAEYAPLEKSVRDVVETNYGKGEADAIFKSMSGSAAHVYTETAVYRPDLSYSAH